MNAIKLPSWERLIVGGAASIGCALELLAAHWSAATWAIACLLAIRWAWSLEDRLEARQQ